VWLGVKHNGWGALAWADKVACAKWLRVGGIGGIRFQVQQGQQVSVANRSLNACTD